MDTFAKLIRNYFFILIVICIVLLFVRPANAGSFPFPVINTVATGSASISSIVAGAVGAGSGLLNNPGFSGSSAINSSIAVSGSAFLSKAAISPNGWASVSQSVSAASLASSVLRFAVSPPGLALGVASGLIAYYANAHVLPANDGSMVVVPIVLSGSSPNTCDQVGGVGDSAFSSDKLTKFTIVQGDYIHYPCPNNSSGNPSCPSLAQPNLPWPVVCAYPNSTGVLPAGLPIDTATAQIKLINSAPTAAIAQAVINTISGIDKEPFYKSGVLVYPDVGSATITAPAPFTAPAQQSVNPTGQVQTGSTTTTCTQTNTTTISCVDTTTTTTIQPDGSTVTANTSNPTPSAVPNAKNTPPVDVPKTDCQLHPLAVGCLELGTVAASEVIPTSNISLALSPTSLGAGFCPSPNIVNYSKGSLSVSYQPLCNLATGVKPLVLALAWLGAGLLVLAPVRG